MRKEAGARVTCPDSLDGPPVDTTHGRSQTLLKGLPGQGGGEGPWKGPGSKAEMPHPHSSW